jgi:hypothetical protein
VRWPSLTVVVAVFIVLIMISPTSSDLGLSSSPSGDSAPSSSTPNPFYPYLTNPSLYPTPNDLPNVTGNVSLPQISTVTIGNTFFYVMIFVEQIPELGNVIAFDSGSYNSAVAQTIALKGCAANCSEHLPILWNGAVPIAAYGNTPIVSDTLVVTNPGYTGENQAILVGASANNSTMVYVSTDFGVQGSWDALTAQGPLEGIDPQINVAIDTCAVTVVTHTLGATFAWIAQKCYTTLPAELGPREGATGSNSDGLRAATSTSASALSKSSTKDPPAITGLLPQVATSGQTVIAYGTGFSSLQSVRVGGTAVAFSRRSASELTFVMPPGVSGPENVEMLAGGTWASSSCPDQVSAPVAGSPFIAGTPEIFSLSDNATTAGSTITVTGVNLSASDIVYFGSNTVASGNVTVINSTTARVIVPSGSGSVNVSIYVVLHPGQFGVLVESPTTCADVFHYATVYLDGLTPAVGERPLNVTLTGTGFTTSAKAYFGTKSATTTFISASELTAQVPASKGTVSVTVHQGSVVTDSLPFEYALVSPQVTGIEPNQGPKGTTVTVFGANFNSSSIVHFGSKNSTSISLDSSGQLTAVAPSTKGTVNVTVHQDGLTSLSECNDLYTYGAKYASGRAEITSLSSTFGESGGNITIHGVNLSTSDTVLFGGVPAQAISSLSNSTSLDVEAPLGIGPIPIEIQTSSQATPLVCGDVFSIVAPGSLVNTLGLSAFVGTQLPATTSAVPITLAQPVFKHPGQTPIGGFYGAYSYAGYGTTIFATMGSSFVEIYVNMFFGWTVVDQTQIATTLGSSVFDKVGDTANTLPGGVAGQLALQPDGTGVIALVTTDENGRTVLESLVSGGVSNTTEAFPALNWSAYFTTPVGGSASDPVLSPAPYEGDYYAAWLENGAGPAQIDEAVLASDGTVVQAPVVVTGSGGASAGGDGAANLSLVVDPMGQPIFTWGWGVGPGSGEIAFTGQYLLPQLLLNYVEAAWSNTTAPDFTNFGGGVLNATKAEYLNFMVKIDADLGVGNLCGAQQNASTVYTNDTWDEFLPVISGPPITKCKVDTPHGWNTLLFNGTGELDASFYMGVETEWLYQALGIGTMPSPVWSGLHSLPPNLGKPYLPDTDQTVGNVRGDSVSVVPATSNDTTLWLHTISVIHPEVSTVTLRNTSNPHVPVCGSVVTTDAPYMYLDNVTVTTPGVGVPISASFAAPTTAPSPVFTHLRWNENGTWASVVTVRFSTRQTVANNGCASGSPANGTTSVKTPSGWPTNETFSLSGNYTTGLDPYPFTLPLIGVQNNTTAGAGTEIYSLHWENTVNSTGLIWLNGTCGIALQCNASWSDPVPAQYDTASGGNLSHAPTPLSGVYFDERSTNGSQAENLSQFPQINAGQVSKNGPDQTDAWTCQMASSQNAGISFNAATVIQNLTTNGATFTWSANHTGALNTSWAEVQTGNSTPINVSAQAFPGPSHTEKYVAQTTGLDSWEIYSLRFFVMTTAACTHGASTVAELTTTASRFEGVFQVPGKPLVFEQDLPYDSVTQEGGGALFAWQVPYRFENQTATKFLGGYLSLTAPLNSSVSTSTVPISPPLRPFTNYSQFGNDVENRSASTFAINLTALNPNTEYTATLVLNYSTSATPKFTASNSLTFWYEKDTTDDGLTNWEKSYGWYVTTTNTYGGTNVQHVTANVNDFATNGLVGDFVEKEYGLNPDTVDSAGSHMLDTWNLTFDLSQTSGALPSGSNFEIWYAQDWYDPFGSGSPLVVDATNLTPSSADGGIHSGDGSPYAAHVLWSSSQLTDFVGMAGVVNTGWLRAIEGTWDGRETLTVEGKLSVGANPLAQSTPGDGIADGARLSPLGGTDLQVTITSYSVSGLNQGDGIAAFINAYSFANPPYTYSNISDYAGFTSQVNANGQGDASYSGNFVVTFPVVPTEQSVNLNLTLEDNLSTTKTPADRVALASPIYAINLTDPSGPLTPSNSNASLDASWQVLTVFSKAPTWLLAPANNTTLSPLPLGLARYTGEQDFDLLVLNDTGATPQTISQSVGGSQPGWSYTVTLLPGLNNLLVPRAVFLSSPLGQALANATAVKLPAVHQDSSLSFNPGDWLGRVTGTGTGDTVGSTNYISVFSSTTQSCGSGNSGQCGGVPSDPALESQYESRQVQAVFWINVSTAGDGQNLSSGTSELANLLGGLVLNSTGNVSENLLNFTSDLSTLGFDSNVLTSLANATVTNDGAYVSPYSTAQPAPPPPPPQPWWDQVASDVWNSVSGAINDVVAAVSHVVSVVWNSVTAAAAYLTDAAVALSNKLGITALVSQAAAALRQVGQAMWDALHALLSFLLTLVEELLQPVTQPIVSAIQAYDRSVNSAFEKAVYDTRTNGSLAAGDAYGIWDSLSGSVFLFSLGISIAVGVALIVVSSIDVGPSFVVDILIGLVVGTLVSEAVNGLLGSVLSDFSTFGSSAVHALEGFFNRTVGTQRPHPGTAVVSGGNNASNDSPSWSTVGLVVGTLGEFGIGFPLDLVTMYKATQKSGAGAAAAVITGIAALVIDLVAMVVFVGGLTSPSLALFMFGLALSLASLYLTYTSIGDEKEEPTPDTDLINLLYFDVVLDVINIGADVSVFAYTETHG